MPKLKPEAPPQDPVEQDFLEALGRLQLGAPRDKGLKAKKAKGTLRITVQNVAIEAGRSRTLIALEKCRYPRVRQMILQAKEGLEGPPTTHSELIDRLRADKAALTVQVAKYKAEATAHFLAKVRAEKDAARESATAARLRKNKPGPQTAVVRLASSDLQDGASPA
jgi:hypothetical protein